MFSAMLGHCIVLPQVRPMVHELFSHTRHLRMLSAIVGHRVGGRLSGSLARGLSEATV